ncbi:MAG: type VI immunity family protein [Archangium sp.]
MSKPYPRVRQYTEQGDLALREGLHLCFFMRRSHGEVFPSVARALDAYLHTVGRGKLGWYATPEGEMQPLDEQGWEYVHSRLLETPHAEACPIELFEHAHQVSGYRFEYRGRKLDSPAAARWPGLVSGVSFWLPTEYLEEQGPGQVRELAVMLARELPLTAGYASLAFNSIELLGADWIISESCFQYPGLDVHDLSSTILAVGTKVRGPYWLNFYGEPLLGQLGGAEGLRARLPFPEVDVQELGQEKVLVALGKWPVVGNEEQPDALRPYRELTRVLEPYLYEECVYWRALTPDELRRWQRRFLD